MAYEPQFTIRPRLLSLVEKTAALRQQIQGAAIELSWIPGLQKDTRTRNVHASTAIEGNPLTLEQVRALEEGRTLAASDARSQREVLNYFAGLRYVEKHAAKKNIRHEDVLKLHRILSDKVMDQGESGRYRMMAVRDVALQMLERGWIFLRRAGTVILAISVVLWFLSAYPKAPEGATPTQQLAQSFAGRAGHLIEPVIKPLGFDWQIGIGLITSLAAREVFVSTMGVVFNAEAEGNDTTPLRKALLAAKWPDGRVLFTPLTCFTLMVFYVFAMQCVSTVAVVRRETNGWRWPAFQFAYMTALAWTMAFLTRWIAAWITG